MTGLFKQAFQKRQNSIPDEVVSELNKSLPKGFHYVRNNATGHLVIEPTKEKVTRNFSVKINLKENNIPTDLSEAEQMDYIYRTQKKVTGTLFLRDKNGKSRNVAEDPITHEGKNTVTQCRIVPAAFPPAVTSVFTVENDEEIPVKIRRLPYDSMDHILLGNTNISGMKMRWILAEHPKLGEHAGTMSVSSTPDQADSTDDAIKGLKILKAFLDGNIKIDGHSLKNMVSNIQSSTDEIIRDNMDNNDISDRNVENVQDILNFWSVINQLEDKLKIKCNPKEDLTIEDTKFIFTLDLNLLKNQETIYIAPVNKFQVGHLSFRTGQRDEFLKDHSEIESKLVNDAVSDEDIIDEYQKKLIGKDNSSFSYLQRIDCSIMGAKFSLIQLVILYNMTITNVEKNNKGLLLYIGNGKNSDNPWRMITKYAINEDGALQDLEHLVAKYDIKDVIK